MSLMLHEKALLDRVFKVIKTRREYWKEIQSRCGGGDTVVDAKLDMAMHEDWQIYADLRAEFGLPFDHHDAYAVDASPQDDGTHV